MNHAPIQSGIALRVSRQRATVLVALSLLAALLFGAPQTAHAFKAVERGDRGARVATVQRVLGLTVDRHFGSATVRAVKRFQRRRGLAADGVVGRATWRALMRVARRQRAARDGARSRRSRGYSRSHYVRVLQRGLGVAADGVFGPATGRALERFQRRRGLTPDGIAGPATWRALGHPEIRVVLRQRRSAGRGRRSMPAVVRRVLRAADRIARKPYRYGGGHARLNDTGYDCSGSMSYALRHAGLMRGSLNSTGFMSFGRAGRGRWITIYANAGHSYMVIAGRRFDTSAIRETGSRWGPPRSSAGFTVRHPVGL